MTVCLLKPWSAGVFLALLMNFGDPLLATPALASESAKASVLPEDGIAWHFESSSEVIAIGDVHGDFDGLTQILTDQKLLSPNGEWIGGHTQLVLVGDLLGGKDSRLVIELLMKLEKEAPSQGGKVHVLLGNHEIHALRGDFKKMSKKERLNFTDAPELAHWLRTKNSIIQIGDTLYMHGSLGRWAEQVTLGEINSTVRAWLRPGASPPPETFWVVDPKEARGPSFRRGFHSNKKGDRPLDGIKKSNLEAILNQLGAKRVIAGHTPAPQDQITDHTYYGDRVIVIDTKISTEKGGKLSALKLAPQHLEPRYFTRPLGHHPLRQSILSSILKAKKPSSCGARMLSPLVQPL